MHVGNLTRNAIIRSENPPAREGILCSHSARTRSGCALQPLRSLVPVARGHERRPIEWMCTLDRWAPLLQDGRAAPRTASAVFNCLLRRPS